jgi:PncC family amidohydrolase
MVKAEVLYKAPLEESKKMHPDTEKNLMLSKQLVAELQARGMHITTVESCTGGALADTITSTPGASEIMKDSFVTYSNEAKVALGVPPDIIDKYTVYSEETAVAMAEAGLKKSIKADIGVGITGSISRPDPSNPNSHPGSIYLAVKQKDTVISKKLTIAGESRFAIKQKIVTEALTTILRTLTK